MRRRTLIAGALFLSGWALAACRDRPGSPEEAAEPRVVSLSPSTTEAMFAIGAGERLVGRSSHCDRPPEASRLPSVGGFADPNIEAILALRPTIAIGSRSPAGPHLERTLRGHGIDTWFPPTTTVAEIDALLRGLGDRFSRAEQAARVADAMQARIQTVERWAQAKEPVRVVMVFDVSPLFVAGPGGFPDELIRRAGGKNAIDGGGAYPTIDIERLLSLDPEVIIDAMAVGHGAPAASKLPAAPGFSELSAVKNGRVRRLASDAALRPGPRLAEGLTDIARALHDEDPPQ